jgi:hypothetical protein
MATAVKCVFSVFSDTESCQTDDSFHEEDAQTSNGTKKELHSLQEKHIIYCCLKNPKEEECSSNDEAFLMKMIIADEDETNLAEAEVKMEPIALSQLNSAGDGDENITSKAEIFVTKNNVKTIPQHLNYAYCGEELAIFPLYQYVPFIDVILMNSKTLREEKEIGE